MLVSASICLKRTFSTRSSSARRCAAESISGAKSDEISSPPGATSSAARNPVSPKPAASSRMTSPGWGSIASIIHAETGMEKVRWESRRASQPAAAPPQRLRLSAR
jgi:hypothetical protein